MPATVRLEVTLPRRPLVDTGKLLSGLGRAVDDTTAIAEANFQATTRTWKHKPRFVRRRASRRGKSIEGRVTTNHEIYGYVTGGTRRRFVRPRRARALAFRGGYRAKTRRRIIGSHKGGAFGPIRFSKGHWVKGIEAREFQQEIAARRWVNLHNFVIRAWAEARR